MDISPTYLIPYAAFPCKSVTLIANLETLLIILTHARRTPHGKKRSDDLYS